MITLEEYNKEKQIIQSTQSSPHKNEIECPNCKKELWDSNPMVSLLSYPPQKNVHCPSCGYTGFRLE